MQYLNLTQRTVHTVNLHRVIIGCYRATAAIGFIFKV